MSRQVNPAVFVYLETKILPELLPILREFKEFLQEQGIIPTQWFLYGSFVRGTARVSSDIDVGVVLPGSIEFSEFYDARDKFWENRSDRICGHRIEITAYNELPPAEWVGAMRELTL
jgi:predicted nucleotidyltransferase